MFRVFHIQYIYFISMTQDDYYLEMLQYCDRNTLTDGSHVIDYVAAWCYDYLHM